MCNYFVLYIFRSYAQIIVEDGLQRIQQNASQMYKELNWI